MNSKNEVLGTCRVQMDVKVRAGSPELEALLAKVTAGGLPYDCGYTRIEGSGLKKLIDAEQRRIREELRLSLDKLDDSELGLRCGSDDSTVRALAADLLGDRIKAGRPGAFAALLAALAATDSHGKHLLRELFDEVVSPFADSINRKGVKELTRLAADSAAEPVVTYLANERLAFRGHRDADLKAIPGMPLIDLVANIQADRYAYDSAVKAAANKRVRAETIGFDEIARLLPLKHHDLQRFLNSRGIRSLGSFYFFPRLACDRWNKAEVLQGIEFTTARLLHRAQTEFKGQLPDDLHAAMLLADSDEYVKAYIKFLEKKDRANSSETDG